MMSDPAFEHLIARFKRAPDVDMTASEIELLLQFGGSDLWAAKALALHYAKKNDYTKLKPYAERLAQAEPSGENLFNLAVTYRYLGDYARCVEVLIKNEAQLDPTRFHDLMCSSLAYMGKVADAIQHGNCSLELKDKQAGTVQLRNAPVVRPFNRERHQGNIISFSIWGTEIRYLQGALNNAIVARYLYPGWTARFYTDASTPQDFRAALTQNAAQVVMVENLPASKFGTFWRFLVEDDEEVDVYIVRDADSVMNAKERWAVTDWLKSSSAFHVMRDDLQHSELMLAGMWGAHRGNIGNMRDRIAKFQGALPRIGNYRHGDQHFLRSVVWPIARDSVLCHDRCFTFRDPRRYDPAFELPARMHIGQNDWTNWRRAG
jgi:hypothetical protein